MKQLCEQAIALLEAGESFVQSTILNSSGSVPRGTGACMLVLKNGSIVGTVGGGALEAGIIKAAPDIFDKKTAVIFEMVLDGNDAIATGMICGGSATALVEYIDPENAGNLEYFVALRDTLRSAVPAQIVTVPPSEKSDTSRHQFLLRTGGSPLGTIGIDSELLKDIQSGGYDVFTKTEARMVYMHRVGTDGTAYIFGAGHCGEKLAHILYTVGFGTVIIDDRAEFANASRFPDANEIIVPVSMDLPFADIAWNEDSYIVIVTRGHSQDELVLRGALKTKAGYIGMIGSLRKRDSIYARLLNDGYTQSDLDRTASPIGLDIGADTPEEIAISIAAELIKVRSERK